MALATFELEPLLFSTQAPVAPPARGEAINLEKYEKLIQQLAWKCERRLPARASRIHSHDDLVQDGRVVALYCVTKFRPEAGSKFITYLYTALNNWYGRLLNHVWEKEAEVDVEDPDLIIEAMMALPSQLDVDLSIDLQRGHLPFNPRARGLDRDELVLRTG